MHGREEELFARFRRGGDTRALGELYDLVAPELLHVALHLTGDPNEAEDLLQATLVAAIEGAERFEPERRVRPWLLGILTRQARALGRERRRRPEPERLERRPEPAPHEPLAEAELDEALRRALYECPEEWRAVLVLRLRHGLSATEIAHALGRPPGTVRSQLARGVERLRRALPAGLASSLLAGAAATLAAPPARGLAGVREAVLAHAATLPVATTAAVPVLGALAMKTLTLAAAALIALVAGFGALASRNVEPAPTAAPRVALAPNAWAQEPTGAASRTSSPAAPAAPEQRAALAPTESAAGATEATTGALVVTVRRTDDGRPAPERVVLLETGTGSGASALLVRRTDAEGRARFDELAPGGARAGLLGAATVYARIEAGATTGLELALEPGIQVEGRVLDEAGAGVAGARLWLSRGNDSSRGEIAARADGTGHFTLLDVAPGQYVGAFADGFAGSHLIAVRGEPGDRVPLELVLRETGARVAGRVVDEAGRPLAGAQVLLGEEEVRFDVVLPSGLATPSTPPQRTTTDADGRFAFASVALGPQPLQARAPGFGAARDELHVGARGLDGVELVLPRMASVTGVVHDEEGQPVHHARVWCAAGGRFSSARTWTTTEGHFILDGLPAGELTIVASHDAAGVDSLALELASGERRAWDPALRAVPRFHGRLVDPMGAPLGGWVVAVFDRTGPETVWHHDRTGGDGRFTIAGVERVAHELTVGAPGAWREFPRLRRTEVWPESEPLELVVDPLARDAASVHGQVVGPGGVPVPGLEVSVWHEGLRTMRTTEPDADTGRFDMTPVPPGEVRVSVRSSDWPWLVLEPFELEPGERRDLGALELREGGRIVGSMHGVADEHVESLVLSLSSERRVFEAVVERDGRAYRTSPLRPGRWTLRVRGDFVQSATVELEVAAGQELRRDLELEPAGARVVRLVPPAGAPELMPWCSAYDADGHAVWSCGRVPRVGDAYEVTVSLPPGRYRLRAQARPEFGAEATFEILGWQGGQPPLELQLE